MRLARRSFILSFTTNSCKGIDVAKQKIVNSGLKYKTPADKIQVLRKINVKMFFPNFNSGVWLMIKNEIAKENKYKNTDVRIISNSLSCKETVD